MSLAAIVRDIQKLEDQHKQAKAEWEKTDKRIQAELEAARLREAVARQGGLTAEQIEAAEALVLVRGRWEGEGQPSVLADAKRDIASGPTRLRVEYFGAKDYDRWRGQREDHRYGYGPRHGSTVFSIELTEEGRKREDWTDEDRDSALRYIEAKARALKEEGDSQRRVGPRGARW